MIIMIIGDSIQIKLLLLLLNNFDISLLAIKIKMKNLNDEAKHFRLNELPLSIIEKFSSKIKH